MAREGAVLRPADTRRHDQGNGPSPVPALEDSQCRLPEARAPFPRRPREEVRADVRPMTDAEHARHVADVKARLADAQAAGLVTHVLHTIDRGHEVWSYERRLVHDALLQDLYARAAGVPCEHRAILAGGLPGAGKTTVLGRQAVDLSRYLPVNPDLIKEELARRGLVPQVGGLSPMETVRLAHEEASHIAKRLAHRAQAAGKNVIWDVTMARPRTCADRIAALRAAGYAQVDAIFVDVPVHVSLQRADARHRAGHDAYRAGSGLGGRFVPPELILAQADSSWGSVNRATFELVKDRFTSWTRYDNSVDGRAARLVADSTGRSGRRGRRGPARVRERASDNERGR
jgi:predicted kinase